MFLSRRVLCYQQSPPHWGDSRHREEGSKFRHREEGSKFRHREERSDVAIHLPGLRRFARNDGCVDCLVILFLAMT